MRYDKYLNRINKLNKVVNAIYRLRFVLVSIVSLTIVSVLTFEFTKGIVNIEPFDQLTYTYGDVITASSKAFANDSSVEYKAEGSGEWVSKAPTYPGNYEVRAVSKNGFGSQTTSDSIKFTILPKDVEVSISESQITYGNLPKISASLIGQDKIDSYEVSYDDEFSKKTNVKVNKDSVVILDKNGNDISFCYNVIEKEREINVLTRPITVSFKNNEKVYDGKDISELDGEITSGSLANGDVIEFIENETHYSDIGDYTYKKDIVIKRGDKDVTDMYSVSSNKGYLRINKVPLSAYSLDYNEFYNGKTLLENDAYKVNFDCPDLVEGHKVNITFDGEYDTYINSYKPLSTFATFAINVEDKEGNDVTDSYNISKNYGKINVNKRDVAVNFGSFSKSYDGVEASFPLYDVSGNLLESDVVKVEEDLFPKITTPQVVENIVTSVKVVNEAGDNVSDCYNITLNSGLLEILKPTVKFNMPSFGTIAYDATDHYLNNLTLCEEESDPISESFIYELAYPAEVCRRAGTYYSSNAVKISLNGVDVTDCFNVLEPNRPASVILPRQVHPTLYFVENNSDELTYNSYDRSIGLKFNEGEMLDSPMFDSSSVLNSGNYSLYDLGFDILDIYGSSVIDCYEFIDLNTLTIDPKQINIALPGATVVYDGSEHYFGLDYSQFVGDNAICDNDSLNDMGVYGTNAGSYDYYKENVYCSCPDNYIFVFDADVKTNTIEKKKITVDFQDFNETYNGANQYIRFNISEGSLASGDSFVNSYHDGTSYVSDSLVVKNKGTYKKTNFKDFFRQDGLPRIMNSYGVDVTDNYEIVEDFGATGVEVKPYPIEVTFTLNDPQDYVYNGELYDFNNLSLNHPLISGHWFQTYDTYTAKRAGEYTNDNKAYIKIYDAEGVDVSPNYQFTYNYWSKVSIAKADLTIKVEDFNQVYDGLPFSIQYANKDDKFSFIDSCLYEDTAVEYSIKSNAGSVFIEDTTLSELVDINLVSEANPNPLNDYNLTIIYGSCSYQKRDIYFEGLETSHTYNKQTPTLLKVEPVKGDEEFFSRHTITKDDGAVTTTGVYAGRYNLNVDVSKWHLINKNAGNIDVNNYVNYNFINLTSKSVITQRKITITEKGDTFNYDGVTKAKEAFTISNLLEGDALYLEVPDYKEEVTKTKTSYDCIVDMVEKTPRGEQFRFDNYGKVEPIKPTSFKIYATIDGVQVDITKSYSIELKKENVKYLNPIYIK